MKAKLINKALAWLMTLTMVVSMLPASVFAAGSNVAKVGDTEYATIDEAIANWTSGTTLTLLADVTLSDVIQLSSTEHHILDLGTYTMTAASGKNAIVIVACGNGSAERTAITINADATDPGGINAGSKCVVYYKYADGGISTEDRPIIKINGGVFTGSTSSWGTTGIYTIGSAARKCATLEISGGTFNCSINGSGKSKLIIKGGVFNYSVGSQGDSTALRLISGGKFKVLGFMTADSNNTKFWFGTSMANSNVGCYVDDDGYLVVGGPVITEAGETFKASSANYSGWNSLLQYSSAKENGLYYTSVEEAFADNNTTAGSVTVYVDELDMTDIDYKGTIVVPEGESITITTEAGKTLNVEGTAVYIDAEGNELVRDEDGKFVSATPAVTFVAEVNGEKYEDLQEAIVAAAPNGTVELLSDVTVDKWSMISETLSIGGGEIITLDMGGLTIDGNGYTLTVNAIESANNGNHLIYDGDYNVQDLTIKVADSVNGGLGITSGTISNVTFVGGNFGILPADGQITGVHAGDVKIEGCTFKVNGNAIYYETAQDGLVVNDNTFEVPSDKNVIIMYGAEEFTNNTVVSGRTVNVASGSPVVTGNNFNDVRLKVYNDATATIENNTINYLAFNDETVAQSTFTGNTLSESAQAVLEAVTAPTVTYVAEISGVGYTTLSEAMGAAKDGDTVTLLGDLAIDTETYIISDGVSVTLDMNGKKLTVTDSMTSGNYELFYIYGELTVTGDGTIELTSTTDRDWNAMSAIFHNRGGELTIENGTFKNLGGTDMAWVVDNSGNHFGDAVTNVEGGVLESSYTAIRNRMEENSHGASGKATVNVSGGTINGVTSAIWAQAASTSTSSPATGAINVTGGEVGLINTARSAGAECMTTISGGTVNGFKGEVGELTVKGGTLTGDVTILTAEGETANYTITNEGLYAPASYMAEINGVGYATLSEAVVAAQAGETIVLLSDAVLEDTLTIEKSITLDGAGYKLIPADASKTYNSAIMAGNSGWGDDHGETITLNNLVFDGWNTNYGAVRAQGVTLNMDGCEFTNCSASNAAYAVLSLNFTDATISNTAFVDNGSRAVDVNYNGDSSNALVTIDGCTFEGNTTTGAGIVMRSAGKIAVKNSTFVGNTVNTNGNAATLYVGFGAGNEVSGCVFEDNTITTSHTTTKRFATAIFCDGCDVTGNVFGEGNTATRNGENITTTVAVGAYYGPANISGNYWQGEEPVLGEDYTIEYTRNEVAIDSYYTSYEDGQLGGYTELAATVVANNQAELQAALDNCKANTTIQLVAGVNYGVVYMRPTPTNPATKSVDWIGNNYGYESYTCFDGLTILGADGATIDAIKIEGGTYYHTEHSQSATYPVMQSLVELKDVTIDGVTFTGKGGYDPQGYGNALNFSGNNIKVNGLTLRNCVLANAENNARLMYKTESTTFVHRYTYNGVEYAFVPNLKDITVTDCTFNGGYMGMELRETENLTVTNNTFNGVSSRDMLLPANSGCTYTGTITITGNTSDGAGDRFVRGQGIGDATLIIADNTIVNYKGGDSDFIKVNDATGSVTISNNTFEGEVVEAVKENGVWVVVASVNYLAEFNGVKYETVAAALEAAQASGLTDVVITLMGETAKESAIALEDSFYLYGEKAFDKVTFRQADASKVYYIDSIYTGSRNNGGEFVFDGVNILVTGQYIFEGNVKLANNSVVKSVAEANCFIYNGTTSIEPGSKLYGVIEDFRGGDMIVDGGRTDGTYNEVADVQDSIMIVNWSGDTLTLKNGAYVKVNAVNEVGRLTLNAGTSANVYASKLEAWEYITVNGTLATDVKSQIATKVITGAGKITIDAADFDGNEVRVIAANMSGFTGTIVVDGAGYEVREDGLYLVSKAVAEVDGVGYATLAEAVAAADGKTVTLLDNIELTATVKILEGKTITLDLNGKTIDGTDNVRIALMSYGNLTIKDSSAEQNGVVKAGIGTAGNAVNICAGTFTMESGSIYSLNNAILIDDQAAIINIVGGTITAEPATKNSAVMYVSSTSATEINITGGEMVGYNGILLWNNTTINMTSGSIVAQGSTGIQGNGTKDNTKIDISGDASVVGYYSAIYHPQNGELNISENAVLSGWTGVVVKSGKVTISGGTINGTGAADTYRPVSSGYVDTGDALYVEHYDNSTNSENYGTPVVTVTGGTFNSTNGAPIASYANPNKEVAALAEFVSGGTFNKEPAAELAAEGYEFAANDDGTYGVVEVVTELFTLTGITTSLDSSLALNIYYTPLSGATATDYYAVVAHQKEDTVEETTIPYADWGTSGSKKLIRYTGLAAKEMADELTVTIYDADGTAVSKSFTTSFRAYAIGMMSSGQYNPTEDSVWFTALTDMLNYGAAAQQMFGYKTGDLANAGADDFQQYASTEYTLSTDGFSMSGTAWAPSLTLESTILLNFYFNDVTEGMYATYAYTTHAGTPVSATVDYGSFVSGWGHYGVAVPIAIADAGTPVTVTMFHADGSVAGTMTCSANNYLKGMAENNPDVALYPALAKFAASAKEAFAN